MLWLMLASCELLDEPFSSGGRISVLTVAGVVVDPPSLTPGDTVSVEATVVDPDELGYRLLVWTCVPVELPHPEATPLLDPISCLEDTVPVAPFLYRSDSPEAASWTMSSPISPTASEATAVATGLLVALACHDAWCPARLHLIETLLAAPEPDLATVRRLLQRPATWVGPAPRASLHLATRRFDVANGRLREPNTNPTVVGPEAIPLDEGPLQLVFDVVDAEDDVIAAFPYATRGIVDGPGFVIDGQVVIQYAPPRDGGQDRVIVVFDEVDERGVAVYDAVAGRRPR